MLRYIIKIHLGSCFTIFIIILDNKEALLEDNDYKG